MCRIVARVHQGRYDTERELINLRNNGLNKSRVDLVDAANQRLKKKFPKIYQRLVGPIHARKKPKIIKCYCNNPKPLLAILEDIKANNVHVDSLMCDDCWKYDISTTWGYYGLACKKISVAEWVALCDLRADYKFVG